VVARAFVGDVGLLWEISAAKLGIISQQTVSLVKAGWHFVDNERSYRLSYLMLWISPSKRAQGMSI
jgi:hypothetical protein